MEKERYDKVSMSIKDRVEIWSSVYIISLNQRFNVELEV